MDAMALVKLMYLSRITLYKFSNLRKLRNVVIYIDNVINTAALKLFFYEILFIPFWDTMCPK